MPRILVVDDSPTLRKMIMAALRPLQASFGEASTGLEAIENLALYDYDAVTLDLNMPDMHGLEVLAFLRSQTPYARLPVVIVSTRTEDDIQRETLQAGANAYVTKPFAPTELLHQVEALVGKAS